MKRSFRGWFIAASAGVAAATMCNPTSAMTLAHLQPLEDASDDVFTYQFAGAGFEIAPSAADTNLDTDTVGPLGSPIGALLGTSRSETTTHRIDPATGALVDAPDGEDVDTGHDGFSWLKFDLSGIVAPAGERLQATLNLYALDGFGITGAFANPSEDEPAVTEVYAAGGEWSEQELKWTNQDSILPTFGSPVDAVTQTGVDRWISFDVTSLVEAWLGGATNDGFFLRQRDIIPTSTDTGGFTGVVSSLYASSAFDDLDDGSIRPFLKIDVVPEPVTAMTAMMGLGALGLAGRRRRV